MLQRRTTTAIGPLTEPTSIWSTQLMPYTWVVIILVTTGAYLNRSTMTLMPSIAQQLDGRHLFGATSASALAAYALAAAVIAAVGQKIDQRLLITIGAAVILIAGLAMLAVTSMTHVLIIRVCTGLGEAWIDVGLTTWISRYVPNHIRRKMFALFATLWLLPSLVGPVLADGLAATLGWRFGYALPALALLTAIPAVWTARPTNTTLRSFDPTQHASPTTQIISGIVLAAGIGVLTWAATVVSTSSLIAAVTTLAALGCVGWSLSGLLPAGTARFRPGIPAAIAWRASVSVTFSSVGAFVPFMVTDVYHLRPGYAAISLSISGVTWAMGSNVASSKLATDRTPAQILASAAACLAVGTTGIGILLIHETLLIPGLALWAAAGFGMGLATNTTTSLIAEWSSPDTLTANQATVAQVISAGIATVMASVGVLLALLSPSEMRTIFGVLCALATLCNVALIALAKRVVDAAAS